MIVLLEYIVQQLWYLMCSRECLAVLKCNQYKCARIACSTFCTSTISGELQLTNWLYTDLILSKVNNRRESILSYCSPVKGTVNSSFDRATEWLQDQYMTVGYSLFYNLLLILCTTWIWPWNLNGKHFIILQIETCAIAHSQSFLHVYRPYPHYRQY